MVEFDVEYIGHEPDDMKDRIDQINLSAKKRTNKALRKTAREVKADLEDTSPVDTGEYKSSWYIFQADFNEIWVLNEAEHAIHVMMPNSKMVGSSSADVPSQGILHNVKGVARRHSKGLKLNLTNELQALLNAFRIR